MDSRWCCHADSWSWLHQCRGIAHPWSAHLKHRTCNTTRMHTQSTTEEQRWLGFHRRTSWSASVSVTEMRSGCSGPTDFCLSVFRLICKDQCIAARGLQSKRYWFFVVFASRQRPNPITETPRKILSFQGLNTDTVWLSWMSFLWFSGGFTKSHVWLFGGNSFKATGSLVWRVTL